MNNEKAELIDAMATGADITKAAAALALDAYVVRGHKKLKKGGKVGLVGFALFPCPKGGQRRKKSQTGTTIKIPAKKGWLNLRLARNWQQNKVVNLFKLLFN